jgi:hypothetical protein
MTVRLLTHVLEEARSVLERGEAARLVTRAAA